VRGTAAQVGATIAVHPISLTDPPIKRHAVVPVPSELPTSRALKNSFG
jgi:hypothetical protein